MVDISSVLGDVPVTPLKVGGTSLYPADATAAVLNVPLRLGHESPDEVSPASTYADTAAGSSGPVTPYVFVDHAILAHSLSTTQIGNGDNILEALNHASKANASKHDAADNSDGSTSPPAKTQRTTAPPSALRKAHGASWRQQGHVEFAVSEGRSDLVLVGQGDNGEAIVHRPRPDREVLEISGDNAQAVLSPNACVFVANLASTRTDDQLEFSVTQAFQVFGKAYVKIKRDSRSMPYAFVQYETVAESERAIEEGRGLNIDGRLCRTERAKVNRSLYLSRSTGGPITESEARRILAGRGDLEKLWHNTATDKEMFRLQEGIWVQFAFFQDARDAQALFKDNPEYRLEQPALPDDIKLVRLGRPLIPGARTIIGRDHPPAQVHVRRNTDRSSIFIGNLPTAVTQAQLRGLFSTLGSIRGIEIVSKPGIHGVNVFAFVDFSSEEEARRALLGQHFIDGLRLRVELKESPDHRATMVSTGSPRSRANGSRSPDLGRGMIHRETAIARALAAGIHPATVVHIFDPHGSEGMDPSNMVANVVAPPVYAQVQYQAPYYPVQYGYGASASNSEGEAVTQNGGQIYGSPSHVQQPMGAYQYPPVPAVPYYANYPAPPSYVYPLPTADASATSGANPGTTDQQ